MKIMIKKMQTNMFNWPQAMNFNTFFYDKSSSLLFAMINHGPGS